MPVTFPLQNAYQPWKEVNRLLEGLGFMLRKGSTTPAMAEHGEGPFAADAFTKAIEMQLPKSFQEGLMQVLGPGMTGYIAQNFRSPEAIQELRKRMAEEMRSRGPIRDVPGSPIHAPVSVLSTPEHVESIAWKIPGQLEGYPPHAFPALAEYRPTITDPIDLILRGSWYHGMRQGAREAVAPAGEIDKILAAHYGRMSQYSGHPYLTAATERGFPISHHDALSISNKLGEPSGVSLSMLPSKARSFSADEYIHRILPLFGGSPQERVLNLMTPEGRRMLNDAYDVIINRVFSFQRNPEMLNRLGQRAVAQAKTGGTYFKDPIHSIFGELETQGHGTVGSFNQALSQQLQQQGKRHILYNPKRWDEYEMLALDPSYVMPLDYRKAGEYVSPRYERPNAIANTTGASPGIRRGLSQIEDLMRQNKSRLGEIYSERPWTERLNEENKRRLVELISPEFRDLIGNQLFP